MHPKEKIKKVRLRFKNKLLGFSLLLLIVVRSMVLPLTYWEYQIRKDYIINYLCENRFTPEMLCDGQCYLAKKLTERQSNIPDSETLNFQKLLTTPIQCAEPVHFSFQPATSTPGEPLFQPLTLRSRNVPGGIFRPPDRVWFT